MRKVANPQSCVVGNTQTCKDVNTHASEESVSTRSATAALDGLAALATALWGTRMRPPAWHADAACAEADPRLFDGGPGAVTRAKSICATCPVRQLCRADQLRWERRTGRRRLSRSELATVRGGLSASERAELHTLPTSPAADAVA